MRESSVLYTPLSRSFSLLLLNLDRNDRKSALSPMACVAVEETRVSLPL
jgi:hypothetical protein